MLELVLLRNVPPSECAVCHQTANARLVQLYGRPYDRTTLLTKQDESGAGDKRQHNMCSFCGGLADLYNKVRPGTGNWALPSGTSCADEPPAARLAVR